jgi:L-threonylcarbamoyladenylate synthase
MLISVKNVRVVTEEEIRNRRHDPFPVGTIDKQDGRVLHFGSPIVTQALILPTVKSSVLKVDAHAPRRPLIQQAAAILRASGLVAFPTETVYGLGAHALDPKAVRKIFAAKDRPDWDPLIVHVRDVVMARSLAKKLPATFDLLAAKFWPGPLTLVVEKAGHVPGEVTADRSTISVRIPRHPVAAMLLAEAGVPIAAPSANRFGRPSPTRAEHVIKDLGDRVELILDAGPTPVGVESTVLDLTQSPPAILRPGGVSREELEAVLGEIHITAGIADEVARKGLAGPGMTLKHYAPRARVELFESEGELEARAEELRATRERVAELRDPLAETLFAKLRELDADGVDVILCVLPSPQGIGLAVRDRLLRAAGKGGLS